MTASFPSSDLCTATEERGIPEFVGAKADLSLVLWHEVSVDV